MLALSNSSAAGNVATARFVDSMTNVMRSTADNPHRNTVGLGATTHAKLGLAANEFEGTQLVVHAGSTALKGLRWTVSGLPAADAGLEITVRPVGYVRSGRSEGCPFNVTVSVIW